MAHRLTIDEILNGDLRDPEQVAALMQKSVTVPEWAGGKGLQAEYDPKMHPVMNKARYPDIVRADGVEQVTRITLDFQRLATKRMTELTCGIPVKRVYRPENSRQKLVAQYIEKILKRNRIQSVNVERLNMYFAACEVFTLWYSVDQPTNAYGFDSPVKVRCETFTPMNGDELYPYFDELGDMTAMSVGYTRRIGNDNIRFFDTYTADRHVKWSDEAGDWAVVEDEATTLGKIPGIYVWRPAPIWEHTSRTVYEMEWQLSRNGNYLRENAKPKFAVFADRIISYGDEKGPDREGKAVLQFPAGTSAQYITWPGAPEALKYQIDTLRALYFTQLQLPDWSYEKMSQQALSGESRKQLFIDSELKVGDESGPLLEFFDREVNVIKAFLVLMLGEEWREDIESLPVETVITPYHISDDSEKVQTLMEANGNRPLMSQRESIEEYGHSTDVDQTLKEIAEDEQSDSFVSVAPSAPVAPQEQNQEQK